MRFEPPIPVLRIFSADKAYHEHLADGISGNELKAPGRGITVALSGSF